MSDLTLTAAQIAPVNETQCELETYVKATATTITKGQAIAIDGTTGLAVAADASTGAANNVRGIVIAIQGNILTTIKQGSLYGFDLSGMDYDAAAYLSNTASTLADAAGDVSVVVGRVKPMHDVATTPTKVLYVNIPAIM